MKLLGRVLRSRIAAIGVLAAVVLVVAFAVRPSRGAPIALQLPMDPWAVVEVSHRVWENQNYTDPVEPDTGAHWEVYARWWASWALPTWHTETGSLDVDWNGSTWVMSNAVTTSNITQYDTCDVGACGSPTLDHGYAFKLMAFVNNPENVGGRGLVDVRFTASPVDDGWRLTGSPCQQGSAVSPIYPYYFAVVDDGPFESSRSCDNTGPSLTLAFE